MNEEIHARPSTALGFDYNALAEESFAVLALHSKSFNFASKFLGPNRAKRAAILYAFCRLVDDIADETPDRSAAAASLAEISRELKGYGSPRRLVLAARTLLSEDPVYLAAAEQLLIGVQEDLAEEIRFARDRDLIRYSYRVAGTVGLMMCCVLEIKDKAAWPFAIDLGIGMQITNIARDVHEDRTRNRVYLPASRYEGAKSEAQVILSILKLADKYYESAKIGFAYIPWSARLGIMIAAKLYRSIGTELVSRQGDADGQRVYVPLWKKVGLAVGQIGLFVRNILWKPQVFPHDQALHRELFDLPGVNQIDRLADKRTLDPV